MNKETRAIDLKISI